MSLQDTLKLAGDVVDDALTTLKSDGTANDWLVEYRLKEAAWQLTKTAEELSER